MSSIADLTCEPISQLVLIAVCSASLLTTVTTLVTNQLRYQNFRWQNFRSKFPLHWPTFAFGFVFTFLVLLLTEVFGYLSADRYLRISAIIRVYGQDTDMVLYDNTDTDADSVPRSVKMRRAAATHKCE